MVLPSDSSWSLPAMIEVYLAYSAVSNSSADIWHPQHCFNRFAAERKKPSIWKSASVCLTANMASFCMERLNVGCFFFFVESLFCRLLCTIWVLLLFSVLFHSWCIFQAIKWLRTKRVHILSHLMVKCFNKKVSWVPKSFNSWKCQTDIDVKWTPLVEMMNFVTVGRDWNIMDVSNACFINVSGSKLFGFV